VKVIEIFKQDLTAIATQFNWDIEPIIELNKGKGHGHFSTTIAMVGAKKLKTNPQAIAEKVVALLKEKPYYLTVEIAGPGFINVTLDPELVSNVLVNIQQEKSQYGQNEAKDYLYNIELVSANPTGWLHVGHARNAVVGDFLARIFKKDGYKVQTEYYTNDAGNQINILAVTVFVHYLKLIGVDAKMPATCYAGDMYDDIAGFFVDEYADKFKDVKYNDTYVEDPEVHKIFRYKSVDHFMEVIKGQLKAFGVVIEHYSSEQEMYEKHEIEKLLALYQSLGALYEKDGATWLKTTKYGDDKDRVLVKSDATYTYIVPDLATHHIRIERTHANKLINVWGGDHHGYIPRIRAGLALLGNPPDLVDIEMVQMVRLIKDGAEYKMSKRKGTAVWLVDLLEMVGKDSLRYMLAAKTASSHMDLDLDLLQRKNSSNPVYYAQYATARCHSILRQAQERGLPIKMSQTKLLDHQKEIELLITLDNFSEIVRLASKNRASQLVTDYIQLVAKQFHSYYADVKIIDDANLELSAYRLGLVQAVLQVLTNAFDLIGIDVLEKM
jgi:arginyl-tRNA synthetase